MSTMIQTNQLTKSYGSSRGIIDVTFDIQEGEVFGFLGPNGAGKTTTMRTLMGLLHANSGSATIGGLASWLPARRIRLRSQYARCADYRVPGSPTRRRGPDLPAPLGGTPGPGSQQTLPRIFAWQQTKIGVGASLHAQAPPAHPGRTDLRT